MSKLTCIKCNEKKHELEFYRVNEEEPTGLCRECYNEKMREWKRNNRVRVNAYNTVRVKRVSKQAQAYRGLVKLGSAREIK
jgi:hypothetical protein